MNNSIYKCPICGGPTNYSSINYQPQPCLHCHATLKPADQQHGNDQHAPPYGTLFDAGKPNEQTTPAPTPWSVKSEACWHEQYQLMRERSYKLMDENSEKAERIRELEERWPLKLSLEKIKLWATLPATLSLWDTAKNETRTALYLMRAIAHEAENALKEERDK